MNYPRIITPIKLHPNWFHLVKIELGIIGISRSHSPIPIRCELSLYLYKNVIYGLNYKLCNFDAKFGSNYS